MANSVTAMSPADRKKYYRAVDAIMRGVGDMTQLPTVHKLMQKHERERQKLERELRAKFERELRAKFERELRAKHVDCLLSILAGRGMRPTAAQEKRLRAKPLAKLPSLKLALQVKDASDFARRARLTNARK